MTDSPRPAAHNRLAGETSPYLRQHAANPVDWFPWGEEALDLARTTGKPILLSVGYSACHWCHVMAHESFEDDTTAAVMNRHFVNIKVDREERPDIDKIYQLAHQLLTQRAGGWPLTMFLTPDDHTPFFGGTYFPPSPRHGMPAFKDLLLRVVDFLAHHGDEVVQQNAALREALTRAESAPGQGGVTLTDAPLSAARTQLERVFDSANGGFGSRPKFPHPTNLERLLRHYAASALSERPDPRALHMARFTLERMALGGVYDHVGGGFYRYSVDEHWMIPHFEKMLYDNGPLLGLYARTAGLLGSTRFAQVARGIGEWMVREMQSDEGGYFSTLDADSEGAEGKFYVWSAGEVEGLLEPQEYALTSAVFGLDRPPNFEDHHWHLHTFSPPAQAGEALSHTRARGEEILDSALAKLFAARAARVRPARDDKVLVSWNALAISGMVRAGQVLASQRLVDSAVRARDFLHSRMWVEGRLLATYLDGRAHLDAYLDDYAFLLKALLDLLEVRWNREDLDWSVALAEVLLEQFEDPADGGFFFTGNDHERLIHRTKAFTDDALPAGNAVACSSLLRLGHLLGERRYLDAAERALVSAWGGLNQAPHAHNAMLDALEDYLSPPQCVVLRGSGKALVPWLERALRGGALRRNVIAIPEVETALPGVLEHRVAVGEVTAYLCTGHHCEAPTTEFSAFCASLGAHEVALDEVPSAGDQSA